MARLLHPCSRQTCLASNVRYKLSLESDVKKFGVLPLYKGTRCLSHIHEAASHSYIKPVHPNMKILRPYS